MVIIDCLTDNNQRTISEVRNCFTKTGSKLGATGSVAMRFDHLAVLPFQGDSEEQVLEAMLAADVNVVELECDAGRLTIFSPPRGVLQSRNGVTAGVSRNRAGSPRDHLPSAEYQDPESGRLSPLRKVPQHAERL